MSCAVIQQIGQQQAGFVEDLTWPEVVLRARRCRQIDAGQHLAFMHEGLAAARAPQKDYAKMAGALQEQATGQKRKRRGIMDLARALGAIRA